MTMQTRMTIDPDFSGVRFYDLNQSALTPLWKAAGMPYVHVSHGSDTNYIFNGVFPEGEMSASDQDLSKRFALNLINFAHTGDPNAVPRDSGKLSDDHWPPAYGPFSDDPATSLTNIQVIGGPLGTGSVILSDEAEEDDYNNLSLGAQHVLGGDFEYGEIQSHNSQTRQRLLQQEKLIKRCEYVNSLSETLGI